MEALDAANLAQSLYKFLYVLRISLSDDAFKASVVIQVNVCRTDYDFSGVVLCGGEFAREFREVMIVRNSDSSADFAL